MRALRSPEGQFRASQFFWWQPLEHWPSERPPARLFLLGERRLGLKGVGTRRASHWLIYVDLALHEGEAAIGARLPPALGVKVNGVAVWYACCSAVFH